MNSVNSKLPENSCELILNKGLSLNNNFYDKVFATAQIYWDTQKRRYDIVVDWQTPLVRLDATVNSPNMATIDDLRRDHVFSLFSSNVMLEIEGYGYPVLRRTASAPNYQFHYTCCAGRCEKSPQLTALSEINQKIMFLVRNKESGEIRMLGFGEEKDALDGKKHKEKCFTKKNETPAKLPEVLTVPVEWQSGHNNYTLIIGYDLSHSYAQGSIIEQGSCTVVYDISTNTYELCFEAKVKIPDGWELVEIKDGENYGSRVKFVKSFAELKGEKCVPALRAIVNTISK